jgi:hypothetical protein
MSDGSTNDSFANLRGQTFTESRIPALDALSTFVPDGEEPSGILKAPLDQMPSRWYPVTGGHKVLILYEGGEYDRTQFTIEEKAWDHEHCNVCKARIPSMTLCWVTQSGPWVLLCSECKKRMDSYSERSVRR